jgi:hypothetical protein
MWRRIGWDNYRSQQSKSLPRAHRGRGTPCYKVHKLWCFQSNTQVLVPGSIFVFFFSFHKLNTRGRGGWRGGAYLVFFEVLVGRHLRTNPLDKYGVWYLVKPALDVQEDGDITTAVIEDWKKQIKSLKTACDNAKSLSMCVVYVTELKKVVEQCKQQVQQQRDVWQRQRAVTSVQSTGL